MELETIKNNYLSGINELQSSLNSNTPSLSKKREEAINHFKANGFPHTKLENWLYTSIKPVLNSEFVLPKTTSELSSNYANKILNKENAIIFVNGELSAETNVANGINIKVLQSDDEWKDLESELELIEQDPFESINIATFNKGYLIEVEAKSTFDKPLSILHLKTKNNKDAHYSSRIFYKINQLAEINILETFSYDGDESFSYTTNNTTSFQVEAGANVEYIKCQIESDQSLHRSRLKSNIARDARFDNYTISLGARLSRNDFQIDLNEQGANSNTDGLYALRGEQHCDNFSIISHNAPHTESGQLFKGVLDEKSRGVFTGKVIVQRDSQLINSNQLNKNLLLSKKAHVDTRPQLEVYADDVKCAHGATVGQIDEDEVFYLLSRGINEERAKKILCHAYISEVIEKVSSKQIVDKLQEFLYENFEKFALSDEENA